MTKPMPEKPSVDGLEQVWGPVWEQDGTYRFDRDAAGHRDAVYSIDTPPPTASGSLHIGHVFSYTHTDLKARFERMRGKHVFYPMGWDDNGLPTERRVQNYYGVRCDPTLPYDPDFTPPFEGGDGKSSKAADQLPISRRNFIALCDQLTVQDEQQFEELFRTLGLSVDWTQSYRTIDDTSRASAQRAFLRNLERGEAYQADAPTLWDVTFRTAVAQAELEDKEMPGAYHGIAFHRTDGGDDVVIQTTRPELLPACVALVAHPDDERFQDLFGTTVRSPLFDVEVPVLAHHLAQKDKGAGIAMVCTFGDTTDVVWWRELQLPNRAILGFDGRVRSDEPAWIESATGKALYAEMAGKTVFSAKKVVVDALTESGELVGDVKTINHPVKFFEKGDKPLEIVSTRQWYIVNGARDEALKTTLRARGEEIAFHPDFMRVRYDNWVGGLSGDWLISRQRFFGVPIPVWYPLDADGNPVFDQPIVPTEAQLPVDPSSDPAPGYSEDQRGVAGGFQGELDVMDTWATSSLTPQLAGKWETDPALYDLVYPYDVRPQAQDIIRTWLFTTVLRSQLEADTVPWKHASISGFIVDPDRKKMSKSKGNVVTPLSILEQHGADAVRYWAASSKLGTDAAFDPQNPKQIKVGRRLAIKVLNAAKFVYGFPLPEGATSVTEALDVDMLAELGAVVEQATAAFDGFDHARALEITERFFWTFCDDYLELVKERAYGTAADATHETQASAVLALRGAIDVLLRLLAPFLPYATEEVWAWTHETSVHRASWPTAADLPTDAAPTGLLAAVGQALIGIRGAKTSAKASQKTPVTRAVVAAPAETRALIERAAVDLAAVGRIENLSFVDGDELAVTEIELAEQQA
ncbi:MULTISPECIES: valine--tRNA ligase [unclassified Curtobacterium]|uniref:valine--tRNA ligase n=1 Tax=unclassified Curtobacterium TaxID=257496 RepID=UPI000FA1D1E2|nr:MULTISPECIES: valine--tRNA ligase [unclassified Curtobacterium]ROQ04035.1 valyl-tRNA synthetase [Curtobacterium sp. PhB171]ROQ19300.1 valyl-tRNA synthetase [Curtobacterium sp. PhB170]ROS32798.1 valyl-tRNA synthetase [Curtobacterium sp. PhB131]ROS64361.1 valyl-tRNA synthetase [Curtobacterium sp. PhB141]